MSLFGRQAVIVSTAPLASVLATRTRGERSWLFEFFVAPFIDINHELAERMNAAAARHSLKRAPAQAKSAM